MSVYFPIAWSDCDALQWLASRGLFGLGEFDFYSFNQVRLTWRQIRDRKTPTLKEREQ